MARDDLYSCWSTTCGRVAVAYLREGLRGEAAVPGREGLGGARRFTGWGGLGIPSLASSALFLLMFCSRCSSYSESMAAEVRCAPRESSLTCGHCC